MKMNSDRSLSIKELAYIAGFFDGEGSVGINLTKVHGQSYAMAVCISQVDPRPLLFISSFFGGEVRISYSKDYRLGKRKLFYWRLYSKNAKRFLIAILPYLINKKNEAEIAIEFQNLRKSNGGRGNKADPELVCIKKEMSEKIAALKIVNY